MGNADLLTMAWIAAQASTRQSRGHGGSRLRRAIAAVSRNELPRIMARWTCVRCVSALDRHAPCHCAHAAAERLPNTPTQRRRLAASRSGLTQRLCVKYWSAASIRYWAATSSSCHSLLWGRKARAAAALTSDTWRSDDLTLRETRSPAARPLATRSPLDQRVKIAGENMGICRSARQNTHFAYQARYAARIAFEQVRLFPLSWTASSAVGRDILVCIFRGGVWGVPGRGSFHFWTCTAMRMPSLTDRQTPSSGAWTAGRHSPVVQQPYLVIAAREMGHLSDHPVPWLCLHVRSPCFCRGPWNRSARICFRLDEPSLHQLSQIKLSSPQSDVSHKPYSSSLTEEQKLVG